MRKKFSPALVLSWLLALSMVVYSVMLHVHVGTMQKIQGQSIREDIFRFNELGEELSALPEEGPPPLQAARIAGELLALRDGLLFNSDYGELAKSLAADLLSFGVLTGEERMGVAGTLLLAEISEKTRAFYAATQYIIDQLFDKNISKMNVNYFDARVVSDPVNKRISTAIKNLLSGQ